MKLTPESKTARRKQLILLTSGLLALPVFPLLSGMLRGLPAGFWQFPPLLHKPAGAAGFSLPVFVIISLLGVATVWLLLKPSHFGFTIVQPAHRPALRTFPRWGWAGLALVAIAWVIAWTRPAGLGFARYYSFFPLWAGFALLLDGMAFRRGGYSMIARHPGRYLLLYPFSALCWWYFELLNRLVRNWWYEGIDLFGPGAYVLYATLCFSTVLPAVAAAYHLLLTVPGISRAYRHAPVLPVTARLRPGAWMTAGAAGLMLLSLFPEPLFFMTWLAPLMLLGGTCAAAGIRTPFTALSRKNGVPLIASALAALLCGFFWELWNVYSLPKWYYDVPYVAVWHLFEMPLLGYFGYLPFGPICICFTRLIWPAEAE